MPQWSSGNGAFTPSTTTDNWTLDANTAGDVAEVIAISWGGRLTASTGYRTRWCRPTTAATSTFTNLDQEDHQVGHATPLCRIGTFATAAILPTDPKNLFAIDWNAHGGVGYISFPARKGWQIVNGIQEDQVSCRNIAGVDANGSSYTVTWEE